jgi:hypothetical protein
MFCSRLAAVTPEYHLDIVARTMLRILRSVHPHYMLFRAAFSMVTALKSSPAKAPGVASVLARIIMVTT